MNRLRGKPCDLYASLLDLRGLVDGLLSALAVSDPRENDGEWGGNGNRQIVASRAH